MTSSIGPSPATWPCFIQMPRVQSSRSDFMSWETMTTTLDAIQQLADASLGLVDERDVAHAQALVDQENLGVDLGGDGEGQPHVHAAGVVLQRQVREVAKPGEFEDAIDLGLHLADGPGPASRH